MTNDFDLRKKALMDELDGPQPFAPPGGQIDQQMPSAPAPIGGPAPAGPAPMAAPKSPFESQNQTVRGYLDEAVKFNAGNIKGIKDEAGRKSANEAFLQSLIPEIQKRGGSISDIRGDKARVDGRMIDFYRDIEGAADPQYLDVTDQGPVDAGGEFMNAGGPSMGGALLDSALTGDPMAQIQQALAQMSGGRPNLDELLKQLGQ